MPTRTNAPWATIVRLLLAYTSSVLWRERQRYLSAVLAVAFSALLINLQWGLVLGVYAASAVPIDHARADVWVGSAAVPAVDVGQNVSRRYLHRLVAQPEVERAEDYVLDYSVWVRPNGTKVNCLVVGSDLTARSLGAVDQLTPDLRAQLTEPGAVVIDASEMGRLGVSAVGDRAEVARKSVRVVGLVRGLKGLSGPFVFCSLHTARDLLRMTSEQMTFALGRCRSEADAQAVAGRLGTRPDMAAFTARDFSRRTQMYWLFETPGGASTLFMAGLALAIGALVTRQSLYIATVASLREYAVLRALGIPHARLAQFVLTQSAGVGVLGVALALPLVFAVGWAAGLVVGIPMVLSWRVVLVVLTLSVGMAGLAGLATLRALRLTDPHTLLH